MQISFVLAFVLKLDDTVVMMGLYILKGTICQAFALLFYVCNSVRVLCSAYDVHVYLPLDIEFNYNIDLFSCYNVYGAAIIMA